MLLLRGDQRARVGALLRALLRKHSLALPAAPAVAAARTALSRHVLPIARRVATRRLTSGGSFRADGLYRALRSPLPPAKRRRRARLG